jgi:type I restriction enzyme R subunit
LLSHPCLLSSYALRLDIPSPDIQRLETPYRQPRRYSSDELDIDTDGKDGNVIVKDWLVEGKAQLDAAREALRYLCEPVAQPREMEQYLHYFCGDASNANALAETEPFRISFYKAVATFLRA